MRWILNFGHSLWFAHSLFSRIYWWNYVMTQPVSMNHISFVNIHTMEDTESNKRSINYQCPPWAFPMRCYPIRELWSWVVWWLLHFPSVLKVQWVCTPYRLRGRIDEGLLCTSSSILVKSLWFDRRRSSYAFHCDTSSDTSSFTPTLHLGGGLLLKAPNDLTLSPPRTSVLSVNNSQFLVTMSSIWFWARKYLGWVRPDGRFVHVYLWNSFFLPNRVSLSPFPIRCWSVPCRPLPLEFPLGWRCLLARNLVQCCWQPVNSFEGFTLLASLVSARTCLTVTFFGYERSRTKPTMRLLPVFQS